MDCGLGGLHDRRHVALALVAAADQVAVTPIHVVVPELAAWSGGGLAHLDGATAHMAAGAGNQSGHRYNDWHTQISTFLGASQSEQ